MSSVLESVRASEPPELLEQLRAQYPVGGIELTMDLGGSRNLNLLMTSGAGMLVVRTYRPGMSLDRITAIQAARRALRAKGVPASTLLRTRTGETWLRLGGQFIEVEEFVEHDDRLDSWERLERALPVLGRTHSVLQTLAVSPAGRKPPAPNFLNAAEVQEWLPRARLRVETFSLGAGALRFVRSAEKLAARLHERDGVLRGHLPNQLVHGCFWGANVLFRKGEVVLVTDLDFMGESPRIDDLALTLYFAVSSLAVDPSSSAAQSRFHDLVGRYEAALDRPLSTNEREALPLAIARAPLSVLRYVAQAESGEEAQRLIDSMAFDMEWAGSIVDDLAAWRAALA
jgi:Ser/Thr protein kinase RdoA (MazF antagonist)